MQRIIHEYLNKSPVFLMIENLYEYLSSPAEFDGIIWLDDVFVPLCNILSAYIFDFQIPTIKSFNFAPIECPKCDTQEITVCLSGGKDSAAVAYYYLQKGYKVHLYHATGINKAYGNEKKAAQDIADYLGCELFIDTLKLVGTKERYVEHPLKNYLIADGAIHYCLEMGYSPHIAFGNFNRSSLRDNPFEVCAGDCIELWNEYVTIIQRVLPEFRLELPFSTNADTFNLLSSNWELFNLTVSCMSPVRFRAHWKHRTEEKYNVRLAENRCGCCWKCAVEEMWLMDNGYMEYDENFYKHSFEVLEKTVYKETGEVALSPRDLWDQYMFYPFENSKGYKMLRHKKLLKWCNYKGDK